VEVLLGRRRIAIGKIFRKTRVLKLLFRAVLILIGVSLALVILLRFFPPPFSALMVERRIQSWFGESEYTSDYRWVPLEEIAPVMAVAVIAAEDQRFPEHYGFDWKAIEKAVAYNERNDRVRGASTLSQQTAKNLFLWSGRSWPRKAIEACFTILLETTWPKRRILETYLNVVEFGSGIYGVEAAAQRYFGKPAKRLTAAETALLAAVLPNPRRFKVDAPTAYLSELRQWILSQMHQLGGPALLKRFQ
jgi:monofunctional glycosyltransferase